MAAVAAPESVSLAVGSPPAKADTDGRCWKLDAEKKWQLFAAAPETKGEEASIEGLSVQVVNLQDSTSKQIPVLETDKAIVLKTKACKEWGLDEERAVFAFKGSKLHDFEPVANIIAAGLPVALVQQTTISLFWSEEHKHEQVQLSDDHKEFWSHHPDYCQAGQQARAAQPFPPSGIHEFRIQISGSEIGCYDSIGLCDEECEVVHTDDYSDRIAHDEHAWVLELSNRRTRHCDSRDRLKHLWQMHSKMVLMFTLDYDAGTLSVEAKGKEKHEIFTELPRIPLYLVAQVCGHEGNPRIKIIQNEADIVEGGMDSSDESEDEYEE